MKHVVRKTSWVQLELPLRQVYRPTAADLKTVESMVHRFVNETFRKHGTIDISIDKEDMIQTAWLYVCEAIRQYDPRRGAKLSTFIFLKLATKFSNVRRKLFTHSKKKTTCVSAVPGLSDTIDGTHETDTCPYMSPDLQDHLRSRGQDIGANIDARNFLRSMTDEERSMAYRYYVLKEKKADLDRECPGITAQLQDIRLNAKRYMKGAVA